MITDVFSPDQMLAQGAAAALRIQQPCVIALVGQLGAGKTHWTQGFASGLGSSSVVTSPTFGLVHLYHDGKWPIAHFDFYRLGNRGELIDIGWDEYLDDSNTVIICEWADRFPEMLPADSIWVEIEHLPNAARRVSERWPG